MFHLIIMVPKLDNTLWFCSDTIHQLNEVAQLNCYPMPQMDELVEYLSKSHSSIYPLQISLRIIGKYPLESERDSQLISKCYLGLSEAHYLGSPIRWGPSNPMRRRSKPSLLALCILLGAVMVIGRGQMQT